MIDIKFRIWDGKDMDEFSSKWMLDNGNYEHGINTDNIIFLLHIGKQDKNGTDIFDGHVVKFNNLSYNGKEHVMSEYISVVQWQDIGFYIEGMRYKYYKCYEGQWQDEEENVDTDKMEIIGNIYQNPELLNQLK